MNLKEKVLIGEDAEFGLGELVVKTTGTIDGLYRLRARGATSDIPAFVPLGSWFFADDIDLVVGDEVEEPQYVQFADVTSVSVSASKAEIDTTRLRDVVRGYRSGKSDMTGSFDGNKTVGGDEDEQDLRNKLLANVVEVVDMVNGEKHEINDDVIWAFIYLNKTADLDTLQEVFVAPIRITQLDPFSVSVDGVQNITGSFRIDGSVATPQIVQYVNPET